jgi:hypothetical protein
MKTNIWIAFSFLCLAVALPTNASAATDEGQQTVIQAQSAPIRAESIITPPGRSALQALKDYLRENNLPTGGIHGEGDTLKIFSVQNAKASVAPYSTDFMTIRESLLIQAMLAAKANIVTSISTNVEALRYVTSNSDPVMSQIAQKEDVYKKALASQRKQVELAQKEVSQMLQGVDDAQAKVIEGATFSDKLMSLLDASIKKLDESYDPSNADQAKQKRLDDLKSKLERARRDQKAAEDARAEIEAKEAELVSNKKKEIGSKFALNSNMPLFGATIIQTADTYTDDEVMEVAVAMVWSKKLEKNARTVLLSESEGIGEPLPNKVSFDEYIRSQDLSVFMGPRRYLAADGTINFLGVSAAEIPSDPGLYDNAVDLAEMFAQQHAVLSVISEVSVKKAAEMVRVDRLVDGKIKPEVYQSMVKDLRESAKANISGLNVYDRMDTVHPVTGKPIVVAVAVINSRMIHQSDSVLADTYALLKEFNANQSVREGMREGMARSAEETRDNEKLKAQGRTSGAVAVNERYDPSQAQATQPTRSAGSAPKSEPSANGGQTGTFISKGVLERDF